MANLTERLFRLAVAVKGIDGGLQIIGGMVLFAVPPGVIDRWVHVVIARDLLGPPDGTLARHLEQATVSLSDSRNFLVLYLLVNGAVKLGLVYCLLRKYLQAYPYAVAILGVLVVYVCVHAANTGSVLLFVLAAIDVVVIVLIVREYRQLRAERRHGDPESITAG